MTRRYRKRVKGALPRGYPVDQRRIDAVILADSNHRTVPRARNAGLSLDGHHIIMVQTRSRFAIAGVVDEPPRSSVESKEHGKKHNKPKRRGGVLPAATTGRGPARRETAYRRAARAASRSHYTSSPASVSQ
jgi:hypothetical protein